mmetsp:Transcript_17699/g.48996  ORF Transcript_17699/g.48996 Transcript_17699/m.48996 type:complete len:85 (-) Transcript_17699:3321-3575(-)
MDRWMDGLMDGLQYARQNSVWRNQSHTILVEPLMQTNSTSCVVATLRAAASTERIGGDQKEYSQSYYYLRQFVRLPILRDRERE